MATVKTETIHGVEVTFEVDSKGSFFAIVEDVGQFHGDTLAGVEEQVTKSLKKANAKKAIDVTVLNIRPREKGDFYGASGYVRGDGAIDVTLRGFSDRTRDLLVTIDGKKDKLDAYPHGESVVRRLSATEHAEYVRLQEARILAARALEEFIAARRFNWREYFEAGR